MITCRKVDVLDDDVADTTDEAKALSADNTVGTNTHDRLIATHFQGRLWGIPVRAGLPRATGACGLDP